jgi:hypothetical protein
MFARVRRDSANTMPPRIAVTARARVPATQGSTNQSHPNSQPARNDARARAFHHYQEAGCVIWWVVYRRGSFSLKERYLSAQHAHERCGGLLTCARQLQIVSDDDIEGRAALRHCLELPPIRSS